MSFRGRGGGNLSQANAKASEAAENGKAKEETREEKRARIKASRLQAGKAVLEDNKASWKPRDNEAATDDPFKTLFVGRLSYATTEDTLLKEFEAFGSVKSAKLVLTTKTKKSRGYAFIEYYHQGDMKAAYKSMDGRKIDGRRILVDVERGRTVDDWLPMRLGGHTGKTRVEKKKKGDKDAKEDGEIMDHGSGRGGGYGERGRGYGGGGFRENDRGGYRGGGSSYGSRDGDRYGGKERDYRGGGGGGYRDGGGGGGGYRDGGGSRGGRDRDRDRDRGYEGYGGRHDNRRNDSYQERDRDRGYNRDRGDRDRDRGDRDWRENRGRY